jgi:hypothetical protein
MALGLCGSCEQLRIVERSCYPFEHPEAGNCCGGTAAKPRGHRNVARDLDRDARSTSSRPLRCNVERPLNRIPARHRWHTARHSEPGAAVFTNVDDSGAQVQFDGNTQRIEAATKVGDRARDYNFLPDNRVDANSV